MMAGRQSGLALRLGLALALLCTLPAAASDQDCLACHDDPGMKSESGKSLHVDAAKHKTSVHGDLALHYLPCGREGVSRTLSPRPNPRAALATNERQPRFRKACTRSWAGTPVRAVTARHTRCNVRRNSCRSSVPLAMKMRCTAISLESTPLCVTLETYRRRRVSPAMAARTRFWQPKIPSRRFIIPTFRPPAPTVTRRNS